MKAFKCDLCGSNEIIKKDGMFTCAFCGAKYTDEEVRKILGIVKIDNSDKKKKFV